MARISDAPVRRGAAPLGAVFRLALFYGVAGFGGGYSVLGQLRRDLVERRQWMDGEEFLVLAELSKSLPGTPATNLLALLGQRVGGVRAGVAAAAAFLLPSTVLMIACGAAYGWMRQLAGLTAFFDGMNAAMVGVVAAVTIELGRSALKSRRDLAIALICAIVLAVRLLPEPIVAAAAALIGAAVASRASGKGTGPGPQSERLHAAAPWLVMLGTGTATHLASLVHVLAPIGATTFGGGLAMIPAIEHTVVVEHHWLDAKAFADAIALGQITPGPVAICATFIGYRVAGVVGALVATIAMFLPATVIALAVGHSVSRFRASPLIQGALRALAPAVIGMLAAATFSLGRTSIEDALSAVVAVLAFLALMRFRITPLWPLVAGGLAHLALAWFRVRSS